MPLLKPASSTACTIPLVHSWSIASTYHRALPPIPQVFSGWVSTKVKLSNEGISNKNFSGCESPTRQPPLTRTRFESYFQQFQLGSPELASFTLPSICVSIKMQILFLFKKKKSVQEKPRVINSMRGQGLDISDVQGMT